MVSTSYNYLMKDQIKRCECCGQVHDSSYGSGRFCSSQCARRFSTSEKRVEINNKVSNTLSKFREDKRKARINEYLKNPNLCKICGNPLPYEKRHNATCSKDCCVQYALKIQKTVKRKFVEAGQGRGKSGWYKGFFCNSTYELVYLIYCLDNGFCVERNTKGYKYMFNNKEHIYYPDFRVNGKLVEIKGYITSKVKTKLKAVDEEVVLLLYDDIEYMMNYVDLKYGTHHTKKHNNYDTLYESCKPKYIYVCTHCGKTFSTNLKRYKKDQFIFCSKACMYAHKKRNVKNRQKKLYKIPSGYRLIPGETSYAINDIGIVVSLKTNKFLKTHIRRNETCVIFNNKWHKISDLLSKLDT